MDLFDEKLRQMAAEDKLRVPETLHGRLMCAAQPTYRKKRLVVRKLLILAASIGILGVVVVGAANRLTMADFVDYEMERPEHTPRPTQLTESFKEDVTKGLSPEDTERMISAFESGEMRITTEEESHIMTALWEKYTALYTDVEHQEAAMQAAEDAYYDHGLRDSEVVGSRFEHVQTDPNYDCAEALVVLYLSDGYGYRMLMQAETLELVQAYRLSEETMEDEYFDALWNGTVDEYNAEQAQNAAG